MRSTDMVSHTRHGMRAPHPDIVFRLVPGTPDKQRYSLLHILCKNLGLSPVAWVFEPVLSLKPTAAAPNLVEEPNIMAPKAIHDGRRVF